jgi:uncharacterized membrane protein
MFKEYRKMRVALAVALVASLVAGAWVWLQTRALFRADHAEVVWYRTMQLGRTPWGALRFLPLATGLLLAAAQFLPEMRRERLRLSLHLPVATHRMVLALVGFGLAALAALLLVQGTGLCAATALFYPREVVGTALMTFTPWALAGAAGYLGATLALLEPGPRARAFHGLLAAVTLAAVVLLLLAVPLPAYRYRYRSRES